MPGVRGGPKLRQESREGPPSWGRIAGSDYCNTRRWLQGACGARVRYPHGQTLQCLRKGEGKEIASPAVRTLLRMQQAISGSSAALQGRCIGQEMRPSWSRQPPGRPKGLDIWMRLTRWWMYRSRNRLGEACSWASHVEGTGSQHLAAGQQVLEAENKQTRHNTQTCKQNQEEGQACIRLPLPESARAA